MQGKTKLICITTILVAILFLFGGLGCGLSSLVRKAEPPVVIVLSPANGTTVSQGQEITIQSQATGDKGIVRAELWANGTLVRTDASPLADGQTPFVVVQPWRSEIPGSHVLIVKAYDADGQVGESEPLMINVQEKTIAGGDVQPTAPLPTEPLPTQPLPTAPSATAPPATQPLPTASPTVLPTYTPLPTEPPPTEAPTETPPDSLPQIQVVSPASPHTMVLGGVVTVKMKATDDHGVARIELWADGILYRKDEVGGGQSVNWQMEWTPPALGTYVLEAKALDTKFQPSPAARLEVHVEQTVQPTPVVPVPYGPIWASLGGMESALGGPVGNPASRFYAGQEFEHGFMFWRDNPGGGEDWIYIIKWGVGDSQTAGDLWGWFTDTWQEGEPEYFCAEATPPNGPRRGFGKIWCARAEIRGDLGVAIQEEWGTDGGWHDFERGVMLWDAMNGRIFVLYHVDGDWQAFPD